MLGCVSIAIMMSDAAMTCLREQFPISSASVPLYLSDSPPLPSQLITLSECSLLFGLLCTNCAVMGTNGQNSIEPPRGQALLTLTALLYAENNTFVRRQFDLSISPLAHLPQPSRKRLEDAVYNLMSDTQMHAAARGSAKSREPIASPTPSPTAIASPRGSLTITAQPPSPLIAAGSDIGDASLNTWLCVLLLTLLAGQSTTPSVSIHAVNHTQTVLAELLIANRLQIDSLINGAQSLLTRCLPITGPDPISVSPFRWATNPQAASQLASDLQRAISTKESSPRPLMASRGSDPLMSKGTEFTPDSSACAARVKKCLKRHVMLVNVAKKRTIRVR